MVDSKNFYTFNPILAAKWLLNLYKSMAVFQRLESRILGQGMHMKVLSPESFKEKIKNQIDTAAGLYTE